MRGLPFCTKALAPHRPKVDPLGSPLLVFEFQILNKNFSNHIWIQQRLIFFNY